MAMDIARRTFLGLAALTLTELALGKLYAQEDHPSDSGNGSEESPGPLPVVIYHESAETENSVTRNELREMYMQADSELSRFNSLDFFYILSTYGQDAEILSNLRNKLADDPDLCALGERYVACRGKALEDRNRMYCRLAPQVERYVAQGVFMDETNNNLTIDLLGIIGNDFCDQIFYWNGSSPEEKDRVATELAHQLVTFYSLANLIERTPELHDLFIRRQTADVSENDAVDSFGGYALSISNLEYYCSEDAREAYGERADMYEAVEQAGNESEFLQRPEGTRVWRYVFDHPESAFSEQYLEMLTPPRNNR